MGRRLIATSPVADVNLSDAGSQESARQRSLSRNELERLFTALRDSPSFGGINLLTVKLLLALGVRIGKDGSMTLPDNTRLVAPRADHQIRSLPAAAAFPE